VPLTALRDLQRIILLRHKLVGATIVVAPVFDQCNRRFKIAVLAPLSTQPLMRKPDDHKGRPYGVLLRLLRRDL
jgi:hypothetical protein